MFLHALPYHVENFASYQDLTSWLHPISSISMPVFLPLSNPIPRISQPVCGEKIYFLRESLHARPIKTRCIFSWSNGSFPRRARLTRPSENPWITPVESSRDRRGWTRDEAYRSRGTQPSLRRKWRSWYICSSPITHLVLAYSPIALPPASLSPHPPVSSSCQPLSAPLHGYSLRFLIDARA